MKILINPFNTKLECNTVSHGLYKLANVRPCGYLLIFIIATDVTFRLYSHIMTGIANDRCQIHCSPNQHEADPEDE